MCELERRPITDDDLGFLYNVFASTRMQEMDLTQWNEQEKQQFLQMQFHLQHTQYMKNYKNAEFDIILYQKQPVGRLYVQKIQNEIRIIDIAVLPQYQRKGIGAYFMHALVRQAKDEKLPLTLHVEKNNPALDWYKKLGFKIEEDKEVYFFMQYTPVELQTMVQDA